jgi:carbamoyl-phosphate synthase large subunit
MPFEDGMKLKKKKNYQRLLMSKKKLANPNKVLILGSGGLKIGQAGEFDYSGSQAIKALKEEKINVILINPNIATIQTSEHLADKVYFLPVNTYFVEQVIKKEKPDGILLAFGGQTALNCGMELDQKGILAKYNVKVLGTPVSVIADTEDRDLFIKRLDQISVKTPKSKAVSSMEEGKKAAHEIGYPVMTRVAFALGGRGSGVAYNEKELVEMIRKALTYTSQVLVEEYLGGWKEVEYEVVRDAYDNCITVCNMENFDPLGIHTGESIVVAPSQTLTNHEYHKLREISIRVIRHLGVVGECNIQFALDVKSDEYRVIEVNARLSRSSALASKATGYPLAFIAAKLGLGYSLLKLENQITKKTMACFEPALDYIVVKMPRWDLQKFKQVSKHIGSEMKSVGEVMAIGRKFEEALQKALRMLGIAKHGLVANNPIFRSLDEIKKEIKKPTDKRVFALGEAFKYGMDVDEIYELTKIDKWFLYKIRNIVNVEKELLKCKTLNSISKDLLLRAKQDGFSDFQIAKIVLANMKESLEKKTLLVRNFRKKKKILPVVKQIDTLAAEWPAQTNYLYLTYNGIEDDIKFDTVSSNKKAIVLGSGAYRIGSSVEFDWCAVNAVFALKKMKYHTIMINYNPETVSTDYDVCDKLYFDELTYERILDIYEKENPKGIVVSMGGQIPNNLSMRFLTNHVRVLGTSPKDIDRAEDRNKFSALLDVLEVDQPEWKELTTIHEAKKFAKKVKYPVLIRPSYVLSGAAMNTAFNDNELTTFLEQAADVSKDHPVVISKFILNAKEIEIDAVAKDGEVVVYAISEHIENAGVHSGDASMVLPPQKLYLGTTRQVKKIAKQVAKELCITGPFNMQFIAKDNELKVIECNLRASRSFPFVSKVFKINFIDIATRAMMGEKIPVIDKSSLDLDYVGVKVPQFSFSRLKGADPILSVEMTSTGEVACIGDDIKDAFLKALISAGFKMPRRGSNVLLSVGGEENRFKLLDAMKKLTALDFNIYATEHTAQFLKDHGIRSKRLYKISDRSNGLFKKMLGKNIEDRENIFNYLTGKKLDLVINIPHVNIRSEDHYIIRRLSIDYNVPLITNIQLAELLIESLDDYKLSDLDIKSWDEYQ